MKTSSIEVETSRSTTQSDSIVRQTNKRSSYLSYTTMNNKHIFNDIVAVVSTIWVGFDEFAVQQGKDGSDFQTNLANMTFFISLSLLIIYTDLLQV